VNTDTRNSLIIWGCITCILVVVYLVSFLKRPTLDLEKLSAGLETKKAL
jgi:hypothetical protein